MITLRIKDHEHKANNSWCTALFLNFIDSVTGNEGWFGYEDWPLICNKLEELDILITARRDYLIFKTEEDKLAFILTWS